MKKTLVICLVSLCLLSLAVAHIYAKHTLRPPGGSLPPLLFVNDTLWGQHFDHHSVPAIDDSWIYLGDILYTVSIEETPTVNFQANRAMIGMQIFHSHDGHLPAIPGHAAEIIGESIIVIFEGQYLLFVPLEAQVT